jgi:hypothetical protein
MIDSRVMIGSAWSALIWVMADDSGLSLIGLSSLTQD